MRRELWLFPLWLACNSAIARGDNGVVVDHRPNNAGGQVSDTSVTDPYTGENLWEQSADGFLVPSAVLVRRVAFWGFYWLDNPPTDESFRFRVYDARPGDGLPGAVVHERFENIFARTATGNRLPGDLVDAREYRFTVDLSQSMYLVPSVPYWFEIVQIGDETTGFHWETARGPLDGRAFMNTFVPNWQRVGTSDLAFQLSTVPEPSTIALELTALVSMCAGGPKRRRNCSRLRR